MAGPLGSEQPPPRIKASHLMCRSRFWGVIGAVVSICFAYLAYAHLRDADLLWSQNSWSLLTDSVWIVLALGLVSETRCWRERIFFGLVLLNLLIGVVFPWWTSAPLNYAREAREAVFLFWILAGLASLTTLARPEELKRSDGLRN